MSRHNLAAAWVWCAAAVSAALIVQSALYVWGAHDLMLSGDEWSWIDDYRRILAGQYRWWNWFDFHNEHRIFTTRLALYADTRLCALSGAFALTLNLLLLAASGVALWHLTGPPGTRMPLVFYVAWMLSLCNYENLLNPFQIQFAFAVFFAIAATLATAAATGPHRHSAARPAWLAGGLLCFFLATFSLGGGMMIAPGLLLLLYLRREKPALLAAAALALTAIAALYLWHYPTAPVPGQDPAGWRDLPRIPALVARFCGNVVQEAAFGLGTAAIAGAAWALAATLRARLRGATIPPRRAALLALAGFAVAIALVAARQRAWLGTAEALSPRYTVFTLVLLPCVAHLVLPARLRPWAAPLALALLVRLHTAPLYTLAEHARHDMLLPIKTALLAGRDPRKIDFEDYPRRKPNIDFMREHKLNIFR